MIQKPGPLRWYMFDAVCSPLCNHSARPASLPRPNCCARTGRRRSPSIKSTFSFLRARTPATLAETRLFPSCGIALVTNIFFNDRLCRICRRRTPRNRNFSATRLSGSVTNTNRLAGVTHTSSEGNSAGASVDREGRGKVGRRELRANGSGYTNLMLAGDWIRNDYEIGSVEGAVLGGEQAAAARLEDGEPPRRATE